MFGKKEDEPQLAFDISKFDKDEQNEIERIKKFLEASEIIKAVARQSKFMPGGQIVTPKTIFATDKRVLIRDPNTLGIKSDIDSVSYSQVNAIKLKKGAFTSQITIESGQFENNNEVIPAIPKKKAENIMGIINQHIREAQQFHGFEASQVQQKTTDDDPLVLLKKRLVKGEISAEEYVNLKKILED